MTLLGRRARSKERDLLPVEEPDEVLQWKTIRMSCFVCQGGGGEEG
jgi:hypothetical protein